MTAKTPEELRERMAEAMRKERVRLIEPTSRHLVNIALSAADSAGWQLSQGWQPIETVPKVQHARFDVWSVLENGHGMREADCFSDFWKGEWRIVGVVGDGWTPTHWMPRPAPPSLSASPKATP